MGSGRHKHAQSAEADFRSRPDRRLSAAVLRRFRSLRDLLKASPKGEGFHPSPMGTLKSNTRIRAGLGVRPRGERRSCGILARLFLPASSSIRILRRNASPRPPRSIPWVWLPRRAVWFRGNIQLVDHRDLAVFSSVAKGGAAVWVWRQWGISHGRMAAGRLSVRSHRE